MTDVTPARSFALVVGDYERGRPDYPPDGVRWLAGSTPATVVDLAAGTGKLTAALAAAGHRVVAVEPLLPMLAHLAGTVPAAAVAGYAEAIPVAAGRADVVTVAQAFHWFDAPAALAEIARVLEPGGTLGLIWNLRDESVPWVAELSRVIGADQLSHDWEGAIAGSAFGPPERAEFGWHQRLDLDGLLAAVRSRSYLATMAPQQRDRVLAAVTDLVAATPELAGGGGIVLPYRTVAYRMSLR